MSESAYLKKRCSSCKRHKTMDEFDVRTNASGVPVKFKTCKGCSERQRKYRDKYIEDRKKDALLDIAREELIVVRKVLAMLKEGMTTGEVLAHFTAPFDGSLEGPLPEQGSVIPDHPAVFEAHSDEGQPGSDSEGLSFELEPPPE